MKNEKNLIARILLVVISLFFIYCLFLISKSAPKEDKKAALRDKLLKDKARVNQKIADLTKKHKQIKIEYVKLGIIGAKITRKARIYTISFLLILSVLILLVVIYIACILSSGNTVVALVPIIISLLIAIKYLSEVITAILCIKKISLREVGAYFEDKRLRKLYKKYHYNPKNLDELESSDLSLEEKIQFLRDEVKMIEVSLSEIEND